VYDVCGRRGMIFFPECRDRRGWGHVSGELSKVLAFFETTVVSSSSSGTSEGKSVGKVAGFLSFTEVVRSPVFDGRVFNEILCLRAPP
jgi:hypothetical protein